MSQAQKFPTSPEYMEEIRCATTPAQAKTLGQSREHPLRADWESVKEHVMRAALVAKFTQSEDLRARLLATGNKKLVERADNDAYWGDGNASSLSPPLFYNSNIISYHCSGKHGRGKNRLGVLLMEVRDGLASGTLHVDPVSPITPTSRPEPEETVTENGAEEQTTVAETTPTEPPEQSDASQEQPHQVHSKKPHHTTALERAQKRKQRLRDRRNAWKDASGASVFQIDDDDPQTAVLFQDADVTVPMSALPESAKYVMRRHQYVRKYADNVDFDDDYDDDDYAPEDEDDAARAPSKAVTLSAYLVPQVELTFQRVRDASEGIAAARELLRAMDTCAPTDVATYKAHRQRCLALLPQLFGFVEQPQSELVMMELLETIDALNTCSAI